MSEDGSLSVGYLHWLENDHLELLGLAAEFTKMLPRKPEIATPPELFTDLEAALKVEQLYHEIFTQPRQERSPAYQAGVRAWLKRVLLREKVRSPYQLGTSEQDAFYAGIDEAHRLTSSQGFLVPSLSESR